MTHRQQLTKLQQIADLVLDSRLAQLRVAMRAKQETEGHLADLLLPLPIASEISITSAGKAVIMYQGWADARRFELNIILARQTAIWMEERESARIAFGKQQTLGGIATKLAILRSGNPSRE